MEHGKKWGRSVAMQLEVLVAPVLHEGPVSLGGVN